ncbi:GTP-binding protein SAR1, partial [Mycena latifolia]
TLLHMLKTERFVALQSTLMPTWEEFTIGNMKVSTYDLGGHDVRLARRMWPDYFPGAHAIVYVVDSADSEQLPECKADLETVLAAPELPNVPFLILGNKVDNPAAASEAELRTHLGFHQTTGKVRCRKPSPGHPAHRALHVLGRAEGRVRRRFPMAFEIR